MPRHGKATRISIRTLSNRKSRRKTSRFGEHHDQLAYIIDNLFRPESEKAPFPDDDFFELFRENMPEQCLAVASKKGIAVKLPFTGGDPQVGPPAGGDKGAATSLFKAYPGCHRLIGRGMAIRVCLPLSFERKEALELAASLNRFEATNWVKCHLNGAWYADEESHLLFVSFYPLLDCQWWHLVNLAWSCLIRSRMAGEVLSSPPGVFDAGT